MTEELNENEFTPDEEADPTEVTCDDCGELLEECECEDDFIGSDDDIDECPYCGKADCEC